MQDAMQDARQWLKTTAKQMQEDIEKGAAPKVEKLTVRQFLGKFGYAKRGSWIIGQIRNTLEKFNLRTEPDFEHAYIDSEISIRLNSEVADAQSQEESADPIHQIGTLPAANKKPVSVKPDDAISAATTTMQLQDYSQLPVMTNEWTVKGMISWKSIGANLSLGQPCEYVRQCMDPPELIPLIPKSTSLFDAIGTIAAREYVLVYDTNKVITGIVTASDLSTQFRNLAGPFLLLGEIEGHLRQLIHGKFTVEQMRAASEEGRQVKGYTDLTLGGYHQLLSKGENWDKLDLNVDKAAFTSQLDDVRNIRNAVMHFDPKGLSADKTRTLQNFARFLRKIVR